MGTDDTVSEAESVRGNTHYTTKIYKVPVRSEAQGIVRSFSQMGLLLHLGRSTEKL